jgi:hypothetical protein
MGPKHLLVPVTAALSLGFVAAGDVEGPRSTFESCSMVMEARVCTWVVMDGNAAVEMGATVPMALVEAVPADAEMVWPPQELATIALPPEARSALGVDHMGINWEAHGHPPASFMTQHFDFHFYSITKEEVRSIDCSDQSKPPTLPPHYELPDIDVPGMGVLVGLCVPQMGMHAMPHEDVEEADAFDASMMLGYYGGTPVFFEPMVSRALLLERGDFTLPMPPVAGLPAGVRYPTEFYAEYDDAASQYRLVFGGFDSK